MSRDIRESFNLASRFYGSRVPYHPELFEILAKELRMGPETSVLDICCGAGQVSSAVSRHVGRVVGIDFSEDMLARAPRNGRTDYILHDVNGPIPAPAALDGQMFDHFILGRAIHWVDAGNLGALARAHLAPSGTIALCAARLFPGDAEQDWVRGFFALRDAYSYPEPPVDYAGADKLGAIGFRVRTQLLVRFTMTFDLTALFRHALSFGRAAELIRRDQETFKSKLAELVAPHMENGLIQGPARAGALVYERAA